LTRLRGQADFRITSLTEAIEDTNPGTVPWRSQHLQSVPPSGGGGSSRGTSITDEPETAALVASALATTGFNMMNAHDTTGVLNSFLEGAVDYMGQAVGDALCGPPCAMVGSQLSRIAKDPEGAIAAASTAVDCVFGGNCGDLPFELWDASKAAASTVVDCVFGGNCDAIFRPIPLDVEFYRSRAQRR
jgi:hypothetical protein